MAIFQYPPAPAVTVDTTGLATLTEQQSQTTQLQDINSNTSDVATETTLTSLSNTVTTLDGKIPTLSLDTQVIADSLSVAIASDQVVPVDVSANSAGLATDANLDTTNATLDSIDTQMAELANISTNTQTTAARLDLEPVDQIDTTPLLDTSSTNIPASASSPLQVVASSAANIYKIVSVEDIGSFIGLYSGAPSSEVLVCVLPLGGGTIEVMLPIGTRISLRAMENTAISSGKIALNFLG
jgi:hypothetical protein